MIIDQPANINHQLTWKYNRYTTVGETSATMSSQKRARFVADCELFLGPARSYAYEAYIVKNSRLLVKKNFFSDAK